MEINREPTNDRAESGKIYTLNGADYLDLWKYCEEVGGRDKDRMVTISTWLLAFALAILAYLFTQLAKNDWTPGDPMTIIVPAFAGLVVCGLAGYLIYAYGAYANRYWFMADWIKQNKIGGLSEFHDTNVFIQALAHEKAPDLIGRIDQRIIAYYYSYEKTSTHDLPTTFGMVGVFKILRDITVFLFSLFMFGVLWGLCLELKLCQNS